MAADSPMLHVQRPELADQIGWLIPHLPPIRPIVVRGEADYYGASYEIAAACGLPSPPVSDSTWFHGWTYLSWRDPEALAGYSPSERGHLVSTAAQADFLLQGGYPNARAVSLPYVYAQGRGAVPRRSKSILLAPLHSLPEIRQHEDKLKHEREFAAYAHSLRDSFDCVCACIHSSCVASRQWISELEDYGIPWVTGAMTADANGLRRVRTLLNAFEVVSSNQVGSILFYAAVDGARISVSGPDALLPPLESYRNHPFYQKHPEMIELRKLGHPDRMRERFPSLFVTADLASNFEQVAAEEIGMQHQIPHAEVARLLGWRHCDADADWAGVDRDYARRVFGWLPSVYGSSSAFESLGRALAKHSAPGDDLAEKVTSEAAELKAARKELKGANRAQSELATIKKSWAWRLLAKPLFSIEKRLRGLR